MLFLCPQAEASCCSEAFANIYPITWYHTVVY